VVLGAGFLRLLGARGSELQRRRRLPGAPFPAEFLGPGSPPPVAREGSSRGVSLAPEGRGWAPWMGRV